MLTLQSIIIWIAALILLSFGAIIYLGNKNSSTRRYAAVAVFGSFWAFGMGFYYSAVTPAMLTFWNVYNHYTVSLLAISFAYFATQFGIEGPGDEKTRRAVLIYGSILFFLYFFTNLIIEPVEAGANVTRAYLFTRVGIRFYIPFFAFFSYGFHSLWERYSRSKNSDERRDIRFLTYGSLVGLLPAISVTIFIPSWNGFLDWYWTAPLTTLGWVVFTTYAIARYQLLALRVIVAEVAVFVMSAILFANVFLQDVVFGFGPRIIIFVAFAIVGGFFIKNIIENERQREKLEELSKEVAKANETLQSKVEERTKTLKKTKKHTEGIIESVPSGIVEYGEAGKIIRINESAELMLGTTRDQVIGATPEKDASPLAEVTYARPVEEHAHTEQITRTGGLVAEVEVKTPKARNLQVVSVPIAIPGNKTGILKVIRDITREKIASRAKSEFITIAAHQLRTPLSALKWTLGTMLELGPEKLPEEQRATLQNADKTNQRMIGLVNDLLDVARIEEGKFGYQFHAGDLSSFISSICAEYATEAKLNEITVRTEIPEAITARFDAEKMTLAITNLLDNALRYSKKGDTVTVRLQKVKEVVTIEIIDTGIGIPKDSMEQLFTKFFRAKNAKETTPDGSGLGLFIVKNIVTRHGGEITVQSIEGKGTTMKITLNDTAHHA